MCRSVVLLLAMMTLAACNLTQSDQVTPVPTPDIPQIEILAPANNRQIVESIEFDIDIVARDENPGVSRVELFVDGESINAATPIDATFVPVFRVTMNWRAQGEGFHLIEAVAYRPDGSQSDPAALTIEVLLRE